MKLLLVALCIGSAFAAQSRYDNYKVMSLLAKSEEQFEALKELESLGYLYMDPPTVKDHPVDVVVPPHKFAEIEEIIANFELKSKVVTENLQELIDNEGRSNLRANKMSWTEYHNLETIYEWMEETAEKNPAASIFVAGKSYEGRDLKGLKISYRSGNRGIFMESNIHAREWISSAVSTFIINLLLTSNDSIIRNLAETIDWYFVPIANPDGFVYTHTKDRMWRKTRAPSSSLCTGADPNRNFGFAWGTGGSSSSPCSDTYMGNAAFSEIETRTLAAYYSTVASEIDMYMDLHSYSQLVMWPFGTEAVGTIENEQEHMQVGGAIKEALARRYNTQYKLGNITQTIYVASGGSIDWVKGEKRTPLVFVYELRDLGRYGFALPADQIIPNALEVADSLVDGVAESRKLGYLR